MKTTLCKRPDPNMGDIIIKLFIICGLVIWALLMGGCMSAKKATDFLKKKNELASLCATEYPLHIDTLTTSDTLFHTDTTLQTITSQPDQYYTRDSVTKVITRTITVTNTVEKENTAKIQALNDTLARVARIAILQQGTIEADKKIIKERLHLIIWLIVVILALLAILLRKPIWRAIVAVINPASLLPFKL